MDDATAGSSHIVRRRLGLVLAAMFVTLAMSLNPVVAIQTEAAELPNPIVVENQQMGTNTWQAGRTGFSISDDATGQIKGYASTTSVNKGGSLAFHVSVNPAQSFSANIYRMGWYAGLGGRLMAQVGPLNGTRQSICSPNSTTGIVACTWSPTFTFTVPDSWTSGVYLVLLTNAANYQSYVTFVVRDDNRTADLMYQQSVTTYQAYNNYPIGSGKSLYDFNSYGTTVTATGSVRAAKVSFDRPYADGYGSGQFGGNSWNWERYYIGWLEQSGFDVAYSTNLDTHTSGARLLNHKGFLSAGHDEYWSKAMVDAATTARDAGINLGFFGSNTAYWQIRFEPSTAGSPNRVMVCYKNADRDPVKDSTATVLWRDPPANRPEQGLVGVQYTAHLQNDGNGAIYVVQNSSNWVWEGTGFVDGAQVSGILGYESDRLMAEYPAPVSTSYTILARSPVVDAVGVSEVANTSIYQAPSGAWVFASGTNHWSFGLGKPGVSDQRIQRATANILNRFVGTVPPPPSPPAAPSNLTATAVSSSVVDLAWSDNASNETSYVVERSLDGSTWSVANAALPPGATSWSDTGLAALTDYHYRVKAANAAGASGYSNTVTVKTPAPSAVTFAETFPGANGSPWDPGRWATSTGTSATLDVQSGGGRMRFENVANASAQAAATMPKLADTETYGSFRYTSTAARGYLYLFARGSGDWVSGYPSSSYFIQMTNDGTAATLWRSQSGTTTSLATAAGVSTVTTAKQWIRLRVQGSTISARVWTDGQAEPTNWEISATDTSISSAGVLQLKWWRSGSATGAREVILDDLQVSGAATAPQPPAAPSALTATTVSSTSIDLAWSDNASNETGYVVERSPDGTTGWAVVVLPAASTSYRDSGLAPSTTYHYRVKAINAAGSSPYSNVATAPTAAAPPSTPAAPTGLSASSVSSSTVNLIWVDNADNETAYTVERSRDGATWAVLTSSLPAGTTTYQSGGLEPLTSYTYRVRATNAAGSSPYSNLATATTGAPPPQSPLPPSNLIATAVTSSSISLAWTDNSDNETGFTVERLFRGKKWTVVASLPAGTTTYLDTRLTRSTAYTYRVKATNAAGSSAYSNLLGVTTGN